LANSKLFHVQLTVFCSVCGKWEYIDSKIVSDAIKEAKKKGWKLKNREDWICPKCNGSNLDYRGDK